jgi:hypothetical protein
VDFTRQNHPYKSKTKMAHTPSAEGNLFGKKRTPKTIPGNLCVMGDRNPYRISVDRKNSYLYWGEVALRDARLMIALLTRVSPRGYDEATRHARQVLAYRFVGNNHPYRRYDYSNGQSGAAF